MKSKIKYYWFLFRWFLIGRNFCNMPKWADGIWWIIHKCFWSLAIFGIAVSIHTILS